jgi:hypothetical protein
LAGPRHCHGRTTIAHVAIETYSVLTRLPGPDRVDAKIAAMVLDKRLPATYATLDVSYQLLR